MPYLELARCIGIGFVLASLASGCTNVDETTAGSQSSSGQGGSGGSGGEGAGGDSGHGGTGGRVSTCGLGPIEPSTSVGEGCGRVEPRCPAAPPGAYTPLVAASTCGFGAGKTDCEPIAVPECPSTDALQLTFSVLNPDAPPGCAGDVDIDAVLTSESLSGSWSAQELDPATCAPLGDELTGQLDAQGPCCEQVVDIHFPVGNFTFRVAVQTDWISK